METERILLRHWLESDAEALFKYASDPDVGPRAGWPAHKSVEESREIIRTFFNNDTTWAIVLKETPIASPVSFSTIAHVVSLWKNVRIISRLSSTDLCAGHPARGPTSGSEAYLKSASASDSCQWRSKILSVSIRLFL